ncbi:MAG: sulfurtransferase [Ignavibacteria bacterium GWF2_33_9]|nr:MAG: sulfurtransferase [Ignavibacteria bacterium GWF2_33_9]
MAPFFPNGVFGDDMSLVMALLIGFGFGFSLERAGFGSAKKLTDQFYFKDFAVLKVMFTAIITAMTGLFFLSWMGMINYSQVFVGKTFMMPQVLGGLILGMGFVIGGYCPGTSVVAVVSGKYDAVTFLLGVTFGIFVFGQAFPMLEDFYNSTDMGVVYLYDFFGTSFGVMVFAVLVMAVGMFVAAEWWERKLAKRSAEVQDEK